ncbi:short-chain dehydrogenase/reductase [Mycobacterium kubicae]|uniref:SDR family NAD(P)-dependent oxidoreductase n=1 Tax=Mycobacterium kubicae TaxID=120959 RepID=A0AAX1JF00_9MYCO|nr:oxidoreductase [Mycobacterium kubicae]MCV7096737.1 SDR family NAD(P)-dependent oxidoreductase [Mycobacterium kubicae]ORW01587.1 short-chain dehydrogenase [Mycobacterium kubicae]QNI10833.1 SDR family NAD(P)-dependent oxidoreductase [Mycobacterium kubicae]QPI39041.1 SDR family NAD(P)-dependent oxidoreductase [Mycobacterium kubicae]GFG63070.1 short-chain dehydrogenase/reductase [Mycobacterium kubicae]
MPQATDSKVWFLTGASRGFGLELARAILSRGDRVVATARRADQIRAQFPDAGENLLAVDLDVTNADQVTQAVASAVDAFGRIDVVVNNAGRGLLGAVEEASDAAIRAVYEVNVFGTLTVQRAVLPVLRRQRSGHIINISSVGGLLGGPGWGIYNSTKFAMEGFSEALAQEVKPLGICVTIVEPGYFRTDFLDASSLGTEENIIDDYAATAGATRAHALDVNHAQPGDPVKAAAAIVDIASVPNPPVHLLLGSDCVQAVEDKIRQLQADIDAWRSVSLSTDHDD